MAKKLKSPTEPPHFALNLSREPAIASQSETALMIRNDRDGRILTIENLFNYASSLGQGTPEEATAWVRQARSSR
jgi:hypothetical protein